MSTSTYHHNVSSKASLDISSHAYVEYSNTTPLLSSNISFPWLSSKWISLLVSHSVAQVVCLQSHDGVTYEILRTLRACIYGKVKHGIVLELQRDGVYVRTSMQVAIKIMTRSIIQQNSQHLVENPLMELSTQALLSLPGHEHVLKLMAVLYDEESLYSILPYCNEGELFTVVETWGALSEKACRYYFKQIISGLSYIQEKGVVHRDLSLENILLHNNAATIIDFGLAISVGIGNNGMTEDLPPRGQIGKIVYMAPEIYANVTPYNGYVSDIWSTGVMLFILLTGAPPFERPDLSDARFEMILQGNVSELLDSWGLVHLSTSVRDLLCRILRVKEPHTRLTLLEITQHPWFTL